MKFVFFGSSAISVTVLASLKEASFSPSLIITQPDRPKGRGLELSESPVKTWAKENNIRFVTPEKIRNSEFLESLKAEEPEVGILVSYGKIIPQNMIDLFPKGIVNVHPSLLPKLRGPAPIEFTILNDMKDEVGISIMILDSEMDHGPILAQKKIKIENWPPSKSELYDLLSSEGGKLLAEILPNYLSDKISATPQNHTDATYCQTIEKKDGEISLSDDAYKNFLKFKAFEGWPGVFFFIDKKEAKPDGRPSQKIRIKITNAIFENGEFKILKVIPEGKKEIDYESFTKGLSGK